MVKICDIEQIFTKSDSGFGGWESGKGRFSLQNEDFDSSFFGGFF